MESLHLNEVWDLVKLPKDKKTVEVWYSKPREVLMVQLKDIRLGW